VPHTIDERCNGCTACEGQCPAAAITGEPGGRYAVGAATCIDCGVCGMICPVEAVLDADGRRVPHVPRDRRPRPVVDLDVCNGCGHCVEHCPFQARAVVGRPFYGASCVVEPHRCVACGECTRICIKGAVTLRPLDVRGWDPDEEAARIRRRLGGQG